jgi:PHD/YefM family antitoxin component YafN of YafNO toxin-antitoxin module
VIDGVECRERTACLGAEVVQSEGLRLAMCHVDGQPNGFVVHSRALGRPVEVELLSTVVLVALFIESSPAPRRLRLDLMRRFAKYISSGRDSLRDSSHKLLIVLAWPCNHQIQCEFDEDAMLDLANDIRSLSEFKRNTVDLLDRLRKTGHPLVLTINGKAELVVQDAAAYQALLDRVEAIEGIQQGLADVKAGRTKPARQVFGRLRRKHGIPR